jgi:predicted deacylase
MVVRALSEVRLVPVAPAVGTGSFTGGALRWPTEGRSVATDRVAKCTTEQPRLEETGYRPGHHLFHLTGALPGRLVQQLNRLCVISPRADGVEIAVPYKHRSTFMRVLRGYVDGCDPSPVDTRGPDERYFTGTEIRAFMNDLERRFPRSAKVMDLSALPGAARTHQGRSLYALKISANVSEQVADKPAIVIAAQHHSRELNSAVMALYSMKRLLEGAQDNPALARVLEEREIYIVPTMNPDGLNQVWTRDRMHRKNGRANADGSLGVDLNRNYPAGFGDYGSSSVPSSNIYKGPNAASEPETRTMIALMRHVRPMFYLDFHSSGREVLSLYPPRADVSSEVRAFGRHYANALREPMDYGLRPPSASGEAPHQFWHEGALAYLIEVGESFQPDFSVTEAEEARVWPGIEAALTTWAPARMGHITDEDGAPVAAELRVVEPGIFKRGEASHSRAQDGRYSLWLPLGSYQVEVSADGYQSRMVTVRVDSYNEPVELDMQLTPSYVDSALLAA